MKFRRKAVETDPVVEDAPLEPAEPAAEAAPAEGPFDADDVDDDGVGRVDLGSLLITPEPGRELRIQVNESTQAVESVLLAGPDGALELRAFAAPRGGDLWTEVRPQIAADMAQRGGTATEREGRFGTELFCQLGVQMPDGSNGTQPSRIIGINGPRWMLRATLLGRPALEPEGAGAWEETLTKVVVRRGEGAMMSGEPLPVTLPEQARRVDPGP